jgi:hypothetical protein
MLISISCKHMFLEKMVFKHIFREYWVQNMLISIHFNKKYKDVMLISMYCFLHSGQGYA